MFSPICTVCGSPVRGGEHGPSADFPLPMGHTEQDTQAPSKCVSWFPSIAGWIMREHDWIPKRGRSSSPWCGGRRIPTIRRPASSRDTPSKPLPCSTHGKYTITVHYRVLGRFEPGIGYSPEPANSNEDVEYTVTAVSDEWRIDDAEPNFPHPSRDAMLKWLNDKISTTENPAAKSVYQRALQQLQAQSGSPFAK